jgi:hypothetical protein
VAVATPFDPATLDVEFGLPPPSSEAQRCNFVTSLPAALMHSAYLWTVGEVVLVVLGGAVGAGAEAAAVVMVETEVTPPACCCACARRTCDAGVRSGSMVASGRVRK